MAASVKTARRRSSSPGSAATAGPAVALAARQVRVACVGAGAWGINLVRQFASLNLAKLMLCCDRRQERLELVRSQFPSVAVTTEYAQILRTPEVEAVVIAANAQWHYELVTQALAQGKHVFVEKPLALRAQDAEAMVRLADQQQRCLMVGHLMLYHPAVDALKRLIVQGTLGDLLYLYAQRVNLGTIRNDENALWCFGPHDLSMIVHLMDEMPHLVRAFGQSFLRPGVPDVVFVGLSFPSRRVAQLHMSWLDPNKVRRLTVVGSQKMAVFDDMEATEKLRIYDKGVEGGPSYQSYGEALTLRFGDIHIPRLPTAEPLRLECEHFLQCILQHQRPQTDGRHGLRIVRVLEAAQRSMDLGGVPQEVHDGG